MGFSPALLGEIFLQQGPEGGIGYGADGSGRGGTIVLAADEVKRNAFYTLEALVDRSTGRGELRLSGERRNGSPFRYQAADLALADPGTGAPTMAYLITGGNITAYLGSLAVGSAD